jgi:putative inorganic carbon (hco3(-)) transporter
MPKRILIFLDRFHWLWLALATPFMLFPSPHRIVALLVVPALFLLRWLALHANMQKATKDTQTNNYDRQSAIAYTPLNGVLLLMMIMVLVSLWATPDINNSLPKISGMVLGIGVFFTVVREGVRPRGWIYGCLAFLGMGLGIALISLVDTSWVTNKVPLLNRINARLDTFATGIKSVDSSIHPAEVAGALIWILPMMVVISVALFYFLPRVKTVRARAPGKGFQEIFHGWRMIGAIILFLGATFFLATVFLLSQSRAGYMGLIITLPLLILIAIPPRWRLSYAAILVVLVIVSGILLGSHWEAVRGWVSGSDLSTSTGLSMDSLAGRLELWSRAIYGIQDFPFSGMGMNTFRMILPVLYPLSNFPSQVDFGHAHNEFLQAALDLGIPGLIAFLALYIGCFWMLAEIWRTTRNPSIDNKYWSIVTRSIALGLGGGFLAHLLYGLLDAVALGAKPGVLFWMLMGLLVGLHQQVMEHRTAVDHLVTTRIEKMDSSYD